MAVQKKKHTCRKRTSPHRATRRQRRVARNRSKRRGYERRSSHTLKVPLNKRKRRGGTDYVQELTQWNRQNNCIDSRTIQRFATILRQIKEGDDSSNEPSLWQLLTATNDDDAEKDWVLLPHTKQLQDIQQVNEDMEKYVRKHRLPLSSRETITDWLVSSSGRVPSRTASRQNAIDHVLNPLVLPFVYLWEMREEGILGEQKNQAQAQKNQAEAQKNQAEAQRNQANTVLQEATLTLTRAQEEFKKQNTSFTEAQYTLNEITQRIKLNESLKDVLQKYMDHQDTFTNKGKRSSIVPVTDTK